MKEEIGKRIASIRSDMNMTKEDFAKLLGISGQYLGIVEKGKSCLSYKKLKRLCDLCNLSSDYILFGKLENKIVETKSILSNFSDKELENGCEIIKKLALFIKNK